MTPQRCTARPSGVSLPKAKCVRTWKTSFRNHAQAIGGAVATWPLAARAQQAAMPVGFLRSAQLVDATHLVTVRASLRERILSQAKRERFCVEVRVEAVRSKVCRSSMCASLRNGDAQ